MKSLHIALLVCAICGGLPAGPALAPQPARAESWAGKSVTLAGHQVRCGNAEIMLDRELPSEGGAGDDFLILNPDMINQQPEPVRLFVFSHECGHLTVGDSELKADCWAVNRGVREHWLDRRGLEQVCRSFEGAPETDTHPSAQKRCLNLDRCFASAIAARPATGAPTPDLPVRKRLASVPRKAMSAWRCTPGMNAKDPIGKLIAADSNTSARCR